LALGAPAWLGTCSLFIQVTGLPSELRIKCVIPQKINVDNITSAKPTIAVTVPCKKFGFVGGNLPEVTFLNRYVPGPV